MPLTAATFLKYGRFGMGDSPDWRASAYGLEGDFDRSCVPHSSNHSVIISTYMRRLVEIKHHEWNPWGLVSRIVILMEDI